MAAIERLDRLGELFQVLSDPSRLRIIQSLEKQELCVSDIVERTEISQPAVSHQLRILRQMDIVRTQRAGRKIFYRIADGHMFSIIRDGIDHLKEKE